MQQFFSLLSWRLFIAQHVSGVFQPIIRSSMTTVAASGFTFVLWCVQTWWIHKQNPTRCNSVSSFYFIFIWSSTCFGWHTAHHQKPKTALAAFGFAYVEGCWTCSCWTQSARPRTQHDYIRLEFKRKTQSLFRAGTTFTQAPLAVCAQHNSAVRAL